MCCRPGLKNFCDFRILQFLMVKADAGYLRAMLSFQLQLEVCHHNLKIAADFCARECSCFRVADAGLEALQNENEVNLVVDLPIT